MSERLVGQRSSPKRDAIVEAIGAADGPLTARQIHTIARRRSRGLGIATVYRNLKLLLEADLVRAVVLADGETRYESAGLAHHHHFHCRRCDTVYDLDGCPVGIPDGTTLPGGYRVEGHELTLHGVCPRCARGRGRKGRRNRSPRK
jgi:Fur family ferric uptake transcriptional regulator